ncbi:MAG: STAS domain-containing protein [Phycisphaerae bacterium]|nr:STAS domain-containing protein [Phycisphaerae bacterium]
MSITADENNNVCVLTIDGELIDATVQKFRELAEQALAEDRRDFIVDFGEATRIDSAGLEALTWLKRECDERLGLMKVCNLPEMMKKILEITRLQHHFQQEEFLEEALESFA